MSTTKDKVKEILTANEHIVVLSGVNVAMETGLNGVRAEHLAYDTEEKYGYSNDEIVSSAFFARRGDIFYKYYKEVILNQDPKPGAVHKAIRQLQEAGQIDTIVTRSVYELYEKAGCEDVIDIHGSAEQNVCQTCGKIYGADHIKQAKGTPLCDVCQTPLRPGFILLGEKVDNGKVSHAATAVEEAEVLLIIGSSLRSPLCRNLARYYSGSQMILINKEEALGDENANYRLYGRMDEIVPYVTGYDPDKKPQKKVRKESSKPAKDAD